MNNPLLDFSGLPRFDEIQPAHVAPAIQALIEEANAALESVANPEFAPRWESVSRVLDVATERLARAWGAVSHLNAVADTPELRAAYNASLPVVTEFLTRLGADERLYLKYKAMSEPELNSEQLQARRNALRNFVLGGAELTGQARVRFAAIQERQAQLSQRFSENALDATDQFAYYAPEHEVAGIPADVLQTAHEAAAAEGRDGYKLTLKLPCYLPVMQFAHDADLRRRLYRAYVTRASDEADPPQPAQDNSAVLQELLVLRKEEAQLLGYDNFAQMSLVPKMASSPQEVITFLRELAARARPYALRDLADLRAHAARMQPHKAETEINAWDVPYLSEQLKEHRYAFSEQEVKQYFTAPKVLAGLFGVVQELFDVTIKVDQAPVWDANVSFYRIERAGKLLGQFYLDPAARKGKRGGAWMDDVRCRWLRPDTQSLQTPMAQLVCNFALGVGDKPALLTHDDVITLFHEFGHGLHHLLTQVQEREVSGINGVEWDAVELPSQFMENFCWEWRVVKTMTAHVDSGAALPRALFDKMLAAKNFQSGLHTLRQVEFALFDMLLHTEHDPEQNVMPLLEQVRAEVAVITSPVWNRTAHTFSHIFAGGYAAGYYSYKWAEVLSADAYAAFEESAAEDGTPDRETGRQYCQAILEAGGSRPAMESFKAFRGREPRMDALLRHQGMHGEQ